MQPLGSIIQTLKPPVGIYRAQVHFEPEKEVKITLPSLGYLSELEFIFLLSITTGPNLKLFHKKITVGDITRKEYDSELIMRALVTDLSIAVME